MAAEGDNEGILNSRFMTGLVITVILLNVVFAGILLVYGYKAVNSEYCSIEDLNTEGIGLQTLYSFDSSSDSLTFETVNFVNEQTYSLNDHYCLTANTTSNVPLIFSLFNLDEELLSKSYLTLDYSSVCFEDLQTPLKAVLSCDNCNSTNIANINGYVSSSDTNYVYDNDGVLTVEDNELINQDLKIYQHCKKFFNKMVWSWLAANGLLLIIFLVLLGLDKLTGLFDI